MGKQISQFVKTCHASQTVKVPKGIKPKTKVFPVPEERFSEIHTDIVGPLPESEGMRFLLTVVDRTSRWFDAIPMPNATAGGCADAFIRN